MCSKTVSRYLYRLFTKTCLIDTDTRYYSETPNRYRYKSIARYVSPILVSRYCSSLFLFTLFYGIPSRRLSSRLRGAECLSGGGGRHSLKLSTKTTVFKGVSLLIGGPSMSIGGAKRRPCRYIRVVLLFIKNFILVSLHV